MQKRPSQVSKENEVVKKKNSGDDSNSTMTAATASTVSSAISASTSSVMSAATTNTSTSTAASNSMDTDTMNPEYSVKMIPDYSNIYRANDLNFINKLSDIGITTRMRRVKG